MTEIAILLSNEEIYAFTSKGRVKREHCKNQFMKNSFLKGFCVNSTDYGCENVVNDFVCLFANFTFLFEF